MNVQTEQIGDSAVSPVSEFEGFQSGLQSALPFVEFGNIPDSIVLPAKRIAGGDNAFLTSPRSSWDFIPVTLKISGKSKPETPLEKKQTKKIISTMQ